MKKVDTVTKLNDYIANYDDYRKLNAKRMAIDCDVSAATISRYVQKLGYEDFNHFRFRLIDQQENISSINLEESNVARKLEKLKYSLKELAVFDFSQLKNIKNKKILVYSDPEFEKVGKVFVEKMSLIHEGIVIVKNAAQIEYFMKKNNNNCVIFVIGLLTNIIYNPAYEYWEIRYQGDDNIPKRDNVKSVQLLKTDLNYSKSTVMHLALEMIAEEYLIQCFTKKETINLVNIM